MRTLSLCALLFLASSPAAAQPPSPLATVAELRARAAARGWTAHVSGSVETWCATAPCDADRQELTFDGATLTMLRVVLADAADGFALEATWQSSGAFGFRFTRGTELVDLTWELTYEPPGLNVGFSARDLDAMVAMDPTDGTHAFTLWITRELGRYLASPESLRDTALAQRVALRAAVAGGITQSGTIRMGTFAECFEERSTPEGTGFFEVCPMRMATAAEQRAVMTTLDARLRAERAILRAHYRAFHRALREALSPPP